MEGVADGLRHGFRSERQRHLEPSKEAWARTLEFLDRHLKPDPGPAS